MARSIARQAAMQLVYQRSCGGEKSAETVELAYEHLRDGGKPSNDDMAFIEDVLSGVLAHQEEFDTLIAENSAANGRWIAYQRSTFASCG